MNISDLNKKLKKSGIDENEYYLNGLFGSKNNNDKIALSIKKGKFGIEYETYFIEKGEKHSVIKFDQEKEACDYVYRKLIKKKIESLIQNQSDFLGTTVNERLYLSGLMNEFEIAKKQNKKLAKDILRWLKVDKLSIEKIID
ncbi:hypothetical protein [uncultured Christiangramia sp.]|uniref:hypothetical protein n=1 Tax=uncultured Christiangramia sp. TaxID=503836 RepID=UPI002615043A|nr:hypothetical protein [uncultured Christiangramia sp.]